jgi:hypothetical protein
VAGRRTLGPVDVEAVTDRAERNVAVERGDGTGEGWGWWWAVFCERKSIKDAASTKTTTRTCRMGRGCRLGTRHAVETAVRRGGRRRRV